MKTMCLNQSGSTYWYILEETRNYFFSNLKKKKGNKGNKVHIYFVKIISKEKK